MSRQVLYRHDISFEAGTIFQAWDLLGEDWHGIVSVRGLSCIYDVPKVYPRPHVATHVSNDSTTKKCAGMKFDWSIRGLRGGRFPYGKILKTLSL